MFDLEFEWTVEGGGGERRKDACSKRLLKSKTPRLIVRHRIFGIEQVTVTTRKRKKKKNKKSVERMSETVGQFFFSEETNGFDVTSSEDTDIR